MGCSFKTQQFSNILTIHVVVIEFSHEAVKHCHRTVGFCSDPVISTAYGVIIRLQGLNTLDAYVHVRV